MGIRITVNRRPRLRSLPITPDRFNPALESAR